MDVDARAVAAEQFGKREHFFAGALGGVGEGFEVQRLDLHPAFRHHIPRDGRVDPARKQQEPAPARPSRETAGTLLLSRVDVGGSVADLDPDHHVGVMQIDLQPGGRGQDRTPDLRRDLGGGFREMLV